MQSDGNLVLLNSKENRAVFHTATYGKPGAYLFVRNQGDLVVNSSGHARESLFTLTSRNVKSLTLAVALGSSGANFNFFNIWFYRFLTL
jgi:hypothetical protein